MNRQWIFRNYAWIAIAAVLVGVMAAWKFGGVDKVAWIGASLAGVIGFCYFVQQQQLAEMTLFHQLFTAFNARYDEMNEDLARISSTSGQVRPVPISDRDQIVDYFNLCGEEYLFWKRGYVPQEVWTAWYRGMLWYLERAPFDLIWEEEVATGSYYGLNMEIIRRGAKN